MEAYAIPGQIQGSKYKGLPGLLCAQKLAFVQPLIEVYEMGMEDDHGNLYADDSTIFKRESPGTGCISFFPAGRFL
ncbi:hypothetical protein D3C77_453340 [compost metagenome]